jgi:2'-5' RNA ligase
VAERVRTFIAVNLSDELRARAAEVQRELRAAAPSVKWVDPAGMHFTLKFLGGVEAAQVDRVIAANASALDGQTEFDLSLMGVGAFPRPGAPRVVWLGVTAGGDRMAELARLIETAMTPLGFEPEKRPFSAHMTLGRVKVPPEPELRETIERLREAPVGTMRVDSVAVMKSDLTPQGAIYTRLAEARLLPPGASEGGAAQDG